MFSWFIDNLPWIFSGVGVALAVWFLKIVRNLHMPLSLFRSTSGKTIVGRWVASGEDLEVDNYLSFSYRLRYSGHLDISTSWTGLKVSGTIRGDVIERSRDAESEQPRFEYFTWDFQGIAFLVSGYLIVTYNQTHERYDNAFGILFLKIREHGAEADGFFLARRAIEDTSGITKGIGFGRSVLRKM